MRLYRKSLNSRAEVLTAAVDPLTRGDAEVTAAVRRIAHSLRGSGATYGYPDISDLAAAVEDGEVGDLPTRLKRLLARVKEVASEECLESASILLVEDDPDLARSVVSELTESDCEISIATTVQEAELMLQTRQFSLIILDLLLPDGDGRNLLVRLRQVPNTAATPVFVLTARCGTFTKTECLTLGAEQFFEKPIQDGMLAAAVSAQLRRSSELKAESRADHLTGLPNRAAFANAFDKAVAYSSAAGIPLCVGILDFDHFKLVNDTHGHAAGDEVLRRSAAVLRLTLRQSDVAARWGGEEFVMLLPGTSLKGGVAGVEKALMKVREQDFIGAGGATFTVSFSAGVIEISAGMTCDQAVGLADRYLYRAKAAGRNCVWSPLKPDQSVIPRALLVEDDPPTAALVAELLRSEGLDVVHVSDGNAAVEAATRMGFTIAILDVGLPGCDGFDLLSSLRAKRITARTPVVMLTAMGKEDSVVRGFDLGADDYITKPFEPSVLRARVRRLLGRR